ncbi:MAG: tetratricopeptide repeat protein, partial [Candidatus Omnitrophica bacterium]|nr:tetratricopeptide repeat protein [Candidatus Omnitrophota bacterium]
LGTLWVRLGQPEKAEKQFLEILRIDPDNARAYQNLGVLQARRGDFQAALQNYRRSLAIDPGNESVKEAISGLTRRLELNEKNSP